MVDQASTPPSQATSSIISSLLCSLVSCTSSNRNSESETYKQVLFVSHQHSDLRPVTAVLVSFARTIRGVAKEKSGSFGIAAIARHSLSVATTRLSMLAARVAIILRKYTESETRVVSRNPGRFQSLYSKVYGQTGILSLPGSVKTCSKETVDLQCSQIFF